MGQCNNEGAREAEWDELVARQEADVSRSFVAVVAQRPSVPAEIGVFIRSAFVIDIDGCWFLITAGHVVDQIRELADLEPDAVFWLLRHDGDWGSRTPFNPRTPNQLTTAELAKVWAERATGENASEDVVQAITEVDLGFIALAELYEKNLRFVGVVPLGWDCVGELPDGLLGHEPNWCKWTTKLFGIPTSATGTDVEGKQFRAWFLRLPVEPMGTKPPRMYWAPTWNCDEVSYNVDGTSGGPIFLLGGPSVHLLSVQTAQDRDDEGRRRLIAANPCALFEFLKAYVESAKAEEAGQKGAEQHNHE